MCTTCGCGDPELVPVELHEKILAGNDRTARHNREHFLESGVLALNLMGSPGAGKTAVLELIRGGSRPVGEIARELPVSRPAVSQHLHVLKEAGLVRDRKQGTRRLYSVSP